MRQSPELAVVRRKCFAAWVSLPSVIRSLCTYQFWAMAGCPKRRPITFWWMHPLSWVPSWRLYPNFFGGTPSPFFYMPRTQVQSKYKFICCVCFHQYFLPSHGALMCFQVELDLAKQAHTNDFRWHILGHTLWSCKFKSMTITSDDFDKRCSALCDTVSLEKYLWVGSHKTFSG